MSKNKNICKGLSFAECELAILRMAVDKAEEKIGKRVVNSEDVQNIINIVEDFIKRKKLICYGGTAINNILPECKSPCIFPCKNVVTNTNFINDLA